IGYAYPRRAAHANTNYLKLRPCGPCGEPSTQPGSNDQRYYRNYNLKEDFTHCALLRPWCYGIVADDRFARGRSYQPWPSKFAYMSGLILPAPLASTPVSDQAFEHSQGIGPALSLPGPDSRSYHRQ